MAVIKREVQWIRWLSLTRFSLSIETLVLFSFPPCIALPRWKPPSPIALHMTLTNALLSLHLMVLILRKNAGDLSSILFLVLVARREKFSSGCLTFFYWNFILLIILQISQINLEFYSQIRVRRNTTWYCKFLFTSMRESLSNWNFDNDFPSSSPCDFHPLNLAISVTVWIS